MSDEKKPEIIIDEDENAKVEREKAEAEATALPPAEPAAAATEAPAADVAADEPAPVKPDAGHAHVGQPHDRSRLPPATLSLLLTSLGTQALMSLGQIPHPATNKPEFDLDQARHCIDLIGMLEEKTANNRTPEESQLLDGMLYELRMLFLQSK